MIRAVTKELHRKTVEYKIEGNLFLQNLPLHTEFHINRWSSSEQQSRSLNAFPEELPWALQKNNDVVSMGGMSEFVHQSNRSGLLERKRLSRILGQRVGSRRNRDMWKSWLADLSRLTAEQLTFIDNKLFNESTAGGTMLMRL